MPKHEEKQQVRLPNGMKVTYTKPSPFVAQVLQKVQYG